MRNKAFLQKMPFAHFFDANGGLSGLIYGIFIFCWCLARDLLEHERKVSRVIVGQRVGNFAHRQSVFTDKTLSLLNFEAVKIRYYRFARCLSEDL